MNTKSKLLKSIFISLVLVMGVNNAWAANLYLLPNSNWKSDNARFAAYFFGNGEKWVSMSETVTVGGTTYYKVAAPAGYPKVIFCRMSSAAENNWNSKWNQTGDLTIPTDGKNLFTVPSGSWDGSTTTWGNIELSITYKDQNDAAFSGTHADGHPTKHIYDGGETTLKTASKSGYNFEGWYTEESCTNKVTSLGATAYTANITLYAKWTPVPTLEISTNQQYLRTGKDKLQLNITYANIPDGHCYRVKVGDGYYNGNAEGKNVDRVAISGDGSVTFKSNQPLGLGEQTIKVELWKDGPTSTSSNSVTVTGEQDYQVAVYAYLDGVKSEAGGSVTSSTPIFPTNHIEETITVSQPNPGYSFVNWTASNGNIKFTDPNSLSTTVTATGGGDIYANYTKMYDVQVSVAAGQEGWGSVSTTSTSVGSVSAQQITATANTDLGYEFDHWELSDGITITTGDANSASIKITATKDGSLTAHFRGENRPQEVFLIGTMNGWKESDTDWQFYKLPGESGNTVTLTKTINKSDYHDTGYEFGINIYHSDWDDKYWKNSSSEDTKMTAHNCTGWKFGTKDKDKKTYIDLSVSGEYTFTLAHSGTYNEQALSITYPDKSFIEGDFATAWDENAYPLTENGDIQTVTIPITSKKDVEFRLVSHGKLFGSNTKILVASNSQELSPKNMEDAGAVMTIGAYVEGDYVFSYKKSTNELTVTYPSVNQLQVYSANPAHDAAKKNWDWDSKNGDVYTKTLSLNANTNYTFKAVVNSDFYGKTATLTRKNPSSTLSTEGDDVTIKTDIAGNYTFTFNSSTKALSVTYPEAYTFTYGIETNSNLGTVAVTPDIASGTLVAAGTDLTLSATPNLGYKFVGWYSEAACTNQVSTANPYNFPINSTTTLYAKFVLRKLYIHADFTNNWNSTAQMIQDENNKAVYTYTTTLEAIASKQVGEDWNFGHHFRVMNAQNGADQYLAYNYDNVDGENITYTENIIDGVHETAVKNPTIQFGLTRKSEVTITLTLKSPNDDPKPTVEINANPYYTITHNDATNGTYTIKVGTNEAVSTDTESFADKTITLSATPNSGYHFVGWTVTKNSGGTITVTDDKFTMPAEDVTVAATFEPDTYTITYIDQEGGTFTHEDGYPTTHTYGTDTQLKGAGKMGYTFEGWYTDEACTVGPITTLGATAYTADITLYAKWEIRNLYIHADFVNWGGIQVEPEFKNNSVVYTYTGTLEKKESSWNDLHKMWDGGHHFHYLYSLEGIAMPETQKIAYNYKNVDADNISYTQDLIDAVHLTVDNNPTIQFGLTKKSKVTITLTLRSDIEKTDDKATQPDVAIVAIPYNTITLDQTGARTQGTVTSVEVPNGDPMPAITGDGALPTPQIGYTFMGYFDQKDGKGTQYYNANGTSEYTWDKTEDATLYAYFQPAKITNITLEKEVFEPITSGEAYVTATPTIDPEDIEGVAICWRLLYSNGDEVTEHKAISAGDNNKVKFSIVGLATGTYTIEATLHATACGNGEPLSTLTKNFIIASEYTVTVKYTCDNQEIKASTTKPAHATEPTTLEASEIFGYTFKEWVAGDGVEIKTTSGDGKTITYTATYNGTITAKYTKKKLIYLDLSQEFSESGKWSDPYIYLYGSDGYWDNNKGAGATGDACKAKGAMTKIEGTDIWYYDYSNVAGFTKYLAFTWGNHTNAENFHSCDVIYRGDFSEGTPLFVPATEQTKEEKNGAKYYSKGYWVNYIGEHTGYTLIIYNEAGDKELIRQKFTSANKRMDMTSVIDLEAEHKYQYEVLRDHGYYYKYNSSQLTHTNRGPKPLNTADKGTIITTAAGDYTFTLGYESGDLQISVDYPAAVGDYRILYRDNGTTNWSGNPRPQNWYHPSRIIKKKKDAKDIISFFINHDKNPELQYQTITDIDAATGKITWSNAQDISVDRSQIGTSGVYNFIFTQLNNQFELDENIEPYKGNYYIRVDAVDGKWGNYKTDPDNRMTYSAFSESDANSFGEKFSHYKTQWCPRGTNVKFTIANDYSPCITDTLIRDVTKTWEENMDEHGNLESDGSQDPTADKYSANIRFMWNRNTNKISRAYLSSATNVTKKFLILQGNNKMKDAEGKEIAATEHVPADATLLDDKQNWIYETTIKVQPGARVKLYACYATPEGQNDIANAQYFRGKTGEFIEENTVQILGGEEGEGDTWYTMRVIYDFKTNRLMGAWVPDTEIGDNGLQIDADIMIMREHQEEATCINLTENANSKLTDVKTVYGVMRFNRWILNNRANPKDLDVDHCSTFDGNDRNYDEGKVKEHHPVLPLIEQKSIYERSLYFISFPFDVNLSDVFGFGTYWNEWYIEYYDGLKRAREGFFIDSPPNWKYVTPEMADTFKLRAYQGYILGLDLDYMQYNTSFWTHNMQEVELFFPSTTTMGEIAKEEVTMPALGPEYECKINRPNSDHRVIDSYWRCIGVPSYANYDGLLYAGKNGPEITWKTDRTWTGNYTEFPFLYSWNTTDNTITPRSTREFKFKAMHSYLVQNKSQIYWKAVNVNVTPSPAAIMAREMEETRREYEWRITLTKGEKEQDQTFIRLTNHEQVTTEFDFNQDLSKEFNYGRSDIYTLIGNTKAAANSLPLSEQTTLIPLGLSIEYNGDYTIAMPGRMENIGVTLIDTESNTRTNLSAGMEYTLTLNKGDYNNRFFIEISPIQQTPTDIEYVTGDSNSQDSVRKVLIDNILYIVRDGQIFDARGARVK